MRTKVCLALLALVLALAPKVALADITTTYDTLAPGGHGFYNGSGNSDGDFTTTTATYTDGSISLSLRGAVAHAGAITPTNGDEYDCSGSGACSVQWSVYTGGTSEIGEFAFNLIVDDLTLGKSISGDPSSQAPPIDDSYWTAGSSGHKATGYVPTDVGFQNSEQFAFLNLSPISMGWAPTDQVLVTLSAVDNFDPSIDPSVTIGFNTPSPVPEPSAIVFTLTVIGFLGFNRLRRRRQQA